MRVTFLGFALPRAQFDDLRKRDANMLSATQTFGWAIANALKIADCDVTLLSSEPSTSFPHNPRIWVRGSRFKEDSLPGVTLPFVNLLIAKHVSRFMSALLALTRQAGSETTDVVLVHGVHSPYLAAGLIHQYVRKVPLAVVLTDPPSLKTPFDSRVSLMLKSIDRRLVRLLLSGVSGVVTLAPALARDFAPKAPSLHMEGIAPATIARPHSLEAGSPVVLYAGGIRKDSGIFELIKAADQPDRPWRLDIYGAGPDADEARRKCEAIPGVHFHGLIEQEELRQRYSQATLLINPRPIHLDFVKYSFPSKIMEYVASGVPLVSTRLPTFPSEYEPHILWSEPSVSGLRSAIEQALSRDRASLEEMGTRAAHFVQTERGLVAQGERLRTFLGSLQRTAGR